MEHDEAQERMWKLTEETDILTEQENEVSRKIDTLMEEKRALFNEYPTLSFRRPK